MCIIIYVRVPTCMVMFCSPPADWQTTELSLRVGNLKPSTDYEAEVCRANTVDTVDSCGNCLFCFSTTVPDGVCPCIYKHVAH